MPTSWECFNLQHALCKDPSCTCSSSSCPHQAPVRNQVPLENPVRDLEKHNPTKVDEMIDRLMEVLEPGLENIKGSRQIAREIGMPDRWQVGALVNVARERGCLIGSLHARGYWLIVTQAEFDMTRQNLVVRIGGIQRTLDSLSASWEAEQAARVL